MFPQKQKVPRELIQNIIYKGEKHRTDLFSINKKTNTFQYNRFAVIVPKKVSKSAIERILIKRRVKSALREIFQDQTEQNKNSKEEKNKKDIVIIAFPTINKAPFKKIFQEVKKNKDLLC